MGIFLPSIDGLWIAVGLSCMTIAILTFVRQQASFMALILFIAFTAFGYATTCLHTDRLYDEHFSNNAVIADATEFMGVVVSDPIERNKSIKAEVELTTVRFKDVIVPMEGRILCYFQKSDSAFNIRHGDKLLLAGRLNEITNPKNPAEFNYKRYMHFHQITHQLFLPDGKWMITASGSGLIRNIKAWQRQVISILEQYGINDRELAILSALLIGYKHYLSADQVNAFASAGAMHVLAVSGLHVGIIFLIISSLLKPLNRFKRGRLLHGILVLIALWGYALLTGMSPSVTRAATMFSFVVFAKLINRHTDIFNTLATSAFALLVVNPFLIVEVGFQLSYLAVLGIVVLQPYIAQLWEPKRWLGKRIWEITAVSIAAQVATFPLGLLYFHQFPNYFLLSNLVVIPLATIILPIGVLLVTVSWIPLIANWVGFVLFWLVHLLDVFIQWVEKLPGALIEGIDISIFETYFIYMIILTSGVFLIKRSYSWLIWFLISSCAIEALNIAELKQEENQRSIVIYSVKGHEAMDIIRGREHQFLSTDSLISDFDKMRFHVHHHWWSRGLNEPEFNEWNSGLLEVSETRIVSLDDNTIVDSADHREVEILHIRERTAQPPEKLIAWIHPKSVVLSQNLDWKTRNYWTKALDKQNQAYHDMYEKGAYVVKL
ncbi:MAG: ComEC/Rec2 family competence protein [Flavobacteriales bacterium]